MKYVIVLPDGAADESLPELDGRTPLEAARIPYMDWVAQHGRLGRIVTVPPGYTPATDVATLCLFGYDPDACFTGRAPIEAAAQRLVARDDEMIFRCNFVTVLDGRMKDFTAGHITQPEAERLIADLNDLAAGEDPALHGCTFHSGVSYRNLLFLANASEMELRCQPPHDVPNQEVASLLPQGRGEERVYAIMDRVGEWIADHEVNRVRRGGGRDPVTGVWLWGQGRPMTLEPFVQRFGVSGAVIAGVDIIRGLAALMNMDFIDVPGATGYLDTDYAGKATAALAALDKYDLVVVHIEAPDEAGHLGDAAEKVKALEEIDSRIVGPLLDELRRRGEWKILIAPDHPTPVSTKAHSAVPPPFCFAGHALAPEAPQPFSEAAAQHGPLIEPGHRFMRLFFEA